MPMYRHKTLRFPFAQHRQILVWIADVVELHQIDPIGVQPLQRSMQLSRTGVAIIVFELGREKDPASQSGCGEEVADNALRCPVGGCCIDEFAAPCHQGLQHLGAGLSARGIVADIEDLGGAEPDHRQALARIRDRSCDQPRRAGLLLAQSRQPGRGGEPCASAQQPASRGRQVHESLHPFRSRGSTFPGDAAEHGAGRIWRQPSHHGPARVASRKKNWPRRDRRCQPAEMTCRAVPEPSTGSGERRLLARMLESLKGTAGQ